jgi:hypothetical protein
MVLFLNNRSIKYDMVCMLVYYVGFPRFILLDSSGQLLQSIKDELNYLIQSGKIAPILENSAYC